MYNVFARLEDGNFIFVASRVHLWQATELAQELNASWPREYAVRNSEGEDVDTDECLMNCPHSTATEPSPGSFHQLR